jgi:hypothetical protein
MIETWPGCRLLPAPTSERAYFDEMAENYKDDMSSSKDIASNGVARDAYRSRFDH